MISVILLLSDSQHFSILLLSGYLIVICVNIIFFGVSTIFVGLKYAFVVCSEPKALIDELI